MSLPVRHLPVLQNWDCHLCGTCCKEYLVTVSDEERRRIEAQGWDQDAEIGDLPLFRKSGPSWPSGKEWTCNRAKAACRRRLCKEGSTSIGRICCASCKLCRPYSVIATTAWNGDCASAWPWPPCAARPGLTRSKADASASFW